MMIRWFKALLAAGLFAWGWLVPLARAQEPVWLPKPLQFPPVGKEQRIVGTLDSADFIHRKGTFRTETGALHDFTLPSYGLIFLHNAEVDLRDVPLGASLTFFLFPDGDGGLTHLATAQDAATLQVRAGGKLDEASQNAGRELRTKHLAFVKFRGLPAWIERTEGDRLTVIYLAGDATDFKQTYLKEFAVGRHIQVCVANDELRTWNPPVDNERGSVISVEEIPVAGFGSSGVRMVLSVRHMLEGFRRGRIVRVFGPGWPLKDQPYGESLMGYGYGRMQNRELIECTPKEYPEQFPFRTDFGNAHLPWWKLSGDQPPPQHAEHVVFGELTKVGEEGRSGQFRADRTGSTVDFRLIPAGAARYLNAASALSDIPLGTRCRFHLFQDEKGGFTLASLASDEFSHLNANTITWRVLAVKLPDGKAPGWLHVARQIPEIKNYNGDMEKCQDLGRAILNLSDATRVWKGADRAGLADLTVGDELLANLSGELPGAPSRCTDVWIGVDTHKLVREAQQKKMPQPKK